MAKDKDLDKALKDQGKGKVPKPDEKKIWEKVAKEITKDKKKN